MKKDRRKFINTALMGVAMMYAAPLSAGRKVKSENDLQKSKPWIEISRSAYLHNAAQISKMADGRPLLAVLKNNAYGIGDVEVATILDQSAAVSGIAMVRDDRAIALRSNGVSKPILLMGDFDVELSQALIQHDITLSIYSNATFEKVKRLAKSTEKKISVAIYIDTGLGRMGIPYQEAIQLTKKVAAVPNLSITQAFSTLTTPQDFAQEQIRRFKHITLELGRNGISTGIKHLAPSSSLLDLSDSWQDAVRPGILLHGSFPLAKMEAASKYPMQIPFKLKAPVIRLEKLKPGQTIGFSRFYKVQKNEWIATLPIGWADGYDSGAENGAKVLLGDRLYPVVNVNASHANVSLGENTPVKVGDVATLIGPERPEITPEGFGTLVKRHNYLQINYRESLSKKIYETF